jgi:hypothetical protein
LLAAEHKPIPDRRPLGWQPSQFLSTRAGAERAFQLAERLGSVRHGRDALVSWAVLSKGDFVTEPRDLTDLVPADVRTELQELLGVKVVRSELTYLADAVGQGVQQAPPG